MRILFFTPYNQSTPYIESLIIRFSRDGNSIFLVTLEAKGHLHKILSNHVDQSVGLDIQNNRGLIYLFIKILKIRRFCRKNKVDIVHSHYQEANLISVFAQLFSKTKFIITRHHSDCSYVDTNLKERLADSIINKLSRKYIAPSKKVYDQMILEGTNKRKIELIPYFYDFSDTVSNSKNNKSTFQKKSHFLILEAARFIPEKRHHILIEIIDHLTKAGLDIELILLGKGPLKEKIQDDVSDRNLKNRVHFIGFVEDPKFYYSLADIFVHLSITEASNSAVKEAGMLGTPCIVCQDVGDFSDYIKHMNNGWLVNKEKPMDQTIQILLDIYKDKYDLKMISERFKESIYQTFSSEDILIKYHNIHNS